LIHSIFITAGENSGDKYGGDLVRQLRRIYPQASYFGIGGPQMSIQGVRSLYTIQDLSIVGGFEILSHLPRLKSLFNRLKKEIRSQNPDVAVLIDSPDFNLRLAKLLAGMGIPVLYYVSPTVWAWRKNRLKTIKKYVSLMMLIFPFEMKIYNDHGIPAVYVGHPLIERVRTTQTKTDFFRKYGLNPEKRLITLLPGSRKSEIKYHMPVIIRALKKLSSYRELQFLFLCAESLEPDWLAGFLPQELKKIQIIFSDGYDAMAHSDIVLSSCGSANLEAALLGTPVVSFYRLSPWTYNLGIRFVKIKRFSIVNILNENQIIPELIQNEFTPENLVGEAQRILESGAARSKMQNAFREIRDRLGDKKASRNAAFEIARFLGTNVNR